MNRFLFFSLALLISSPFISFSQNVGVDVAAPAQKLDVAGGLRIATTSNGVAGSIRWNGSNFQVHNGTMWINFGTGVDLYWTLNGANIHSSGAGNVGIGTTTPAAKLQVVGTARVSALDVNGNYTLPTTDGGAGFVLSTDGSGAVSWTDPALVGDITSVVAGAGLVNGGTSGDVTLDVNPGDGIAIVGDAVQVNASALEGSGLSANSNNFDVNVDNSTLEINSDVLRVKSDGINATHIAAGAVTTSEILDGTITNADISTGAVTTSSILDGTIASADLGPGSAGQILATNPLGTSVSWVDPASVTPGLSDDDGDTKVQVEEGVDDDKIRFDTQGSERMIIDETGNVGIGTGTPNYKLEVAGNVGVSGQVFHNGDPNTSIQFTPDRVRVYAGSTSNSWIDIENSALELAINEEGLSRDFRVESDSDPNALIVEGSTNNVGIGTATPASKFEVSGTARVTELNVGGNYSLPTADGLNTYVMQTDGSGTVTWEDPTTIATAIPNHIIDTDLDTKIEVEQGTDDDHIRMSTVGAERMTIEPSGEIGIGTNTPNRNLHVVNATGGQVLVSRGDADTNPGETLGEILFDSEDDTEPSSLDASVVIRGIASEEHGNTNKGGELAFLTKPTFTPGNAVATERMRITNDGNVGIGTNNPNNKLRVSAGSSSWPVRFENNNGYIEFGPANSSYAHIYASQSFYLNQPLYAGSGNVRLNSGSGTSYINGGNFGVGTTGPSQKLDVQGNAVVSGGLRVGGIASTNDIVLTNASGDLYTTNSLVGTGMGDNLGNHTATATLNMNSNSITNASYVSTLGGNSYDKLRVWNSGSYSIGMVSAQTLGYLSDYAMTFTMSNTASRGFLWRDVSDAASDGAMSLTTDGRLYVKSTANFNGNVGLGTASPSQKLHVIGNARISAVAGSGVRNLTVSASGDLTTSQPTAGAAGFWTRTGADVYPTNVNDYVGIGTTNPAYDLDVTGLIRLRTNVGINTNPRTDSYRLSMGGHIHMNNYQLNYVDQVHFNNNVRFYDDGNDSYLNFKYGDAGAGGIKFIDGNSALQGYVYTSGDQNSFGLLDADGQWALRVDNNDYVEVYDNGESMLRIGAGGGVGSANYGSVFTNGGGLGGYEGFNINGRYALMSADNNNVGLYNDVDNRWIVLYNRNSSTRFYDPNGGSEYIEINTNTDMNFRDNNILDVNILETNYLRDGDGGNRIDVQDHMYFADAYNLWDVNDLSVQTIYDAASDIVHMDQTRVRFDPGSSYGIWIERYQYSSAHPNFRPGRNGYGFIGKFNNAWGYSYTIREYRTYEYGLSDRRVKKNITQLDGSSSLDKIMSLEGVRYDLDKDKHPWIGLIENEQHEEETKNNLGFIAQDLMEVIPEMVVLDENTGYYLVKNYEQMFPIVIEAMQEQQKQIESLKAGTGQGQSSKLKSENEELRSMIEELKERLEKLEAKK